ncbi:MAG: Eco57I restriction-modification methylase domain-containing protein [Thermodesulfovibrionales bacterium]
MQRSSATREVDIVIGNPPYVRQEKIAPSNKLKAEVTLEDKREYKEKLLKSIQVHYPFIKKIDKKSDYYIYFYFHGLSLLNDKGTFCFIASNSWLDVGYGKDLQEFLLKYCHVKAIYDNEAKRSFEHTDINTIIALFSSPLSRGAGGVSSPLSRGAGGVSLPLLKMDKRGFGLLKEKFSTGKYEGNKWGSKYLRAPDIFFKILEKAERYRFLEYLEYEGEGVIVEDVTEMIGE